MEDVIETLAELRRRGYILAVGVRVDEREYKPGIHRLTLAERLQVRGGDGPLPEELRAAVRRHQFELLAAACVLRPPAGWVEDVIERWRRGAVPGEALAAQIAGLCGHDPREGGRLWPLLEYVLRHPGMGVTL